MCGGDCPRCCFVVGIIQHFFSELALVHICIPQTYTPCGRVIGNKVLLALVGTHLFVVALPSPFVLLLYHRSCGLSRVFLTFFFGGRWWELNPHSPKANVSEIANLLYLSFLAEVVRSTSSPSVPLLYHTSRDLSRGFLNFFVR